MSEVPYEEFAAKMIDGAKMFGAQVELAEGSSFGSVTFEHQQFLDFCQRLIEMCEPEEPTHDQQ